MVHSDDERRYACNGNVAAEEVGNELFLVQLAQGMTFRMNRTGKAIWELAVDGLTAGAIAERLHLSLGVSADQLQRDATKLLEELVQNGLLELRGEEMR
jgi:DNA-binding CsgD family transcriptional regulator